METSSPDPDPPDHMEHTHSAAPVRGPSVPHASSAPEVLSRTRSTEEGLTPDEAAQRLRAWGPNEIPTQPPPSVCGVVIRQFASPLIHVLGAAGALSLYLGRRVPAHGGVAAGRQGPGGCSRS